MTSHGFLEGGFSTIPLVLIVQIIIIERLG